MLYGSQKLNVQIVPSDVKYGTNEGGIQANMKNGYQLGIDQQYQFDSKKNFTSFLSYDHMNESEMKY
jgi:hypothetical protein